MLLRLIISPTRDELKRLDISVTPLLYVYTHKAIKPIIKKVDPSIPVYQHEDILKLLKSCDVLISLNYSTILLDALILNKPSLVFLPEKQNFEQEEIIKQKAVLSVSNNSELKNQMEKILFNEDVRNDLIKNGKLFIEKYFSFQGNSCEILKNKLLDK